MCRTPFLIRTFFLVGGYWFDSTPLCGLWALAVSDLSTAAWEYLGARLLIKNIINIRDMVCRALVLSVVVLLSAVVGLRLMVVFGL